MEIKKIKKQQNGFLMLPHPLTNLEIQKYYQNEPRFNGVYSRDNLSKIKDGTDKLAPVPADLSKLSDVVKNEVVKETVYDKLVAEVNSIDTSAFVLKAMMQINQK